MIVNKLLPLTSRPNSSDTFVGENLEKYRVITVERTAMALVIYLKGIYTGSDNFTSVIFTGFPLDSHDAKLDS